jgi:hypothetical protein
MKDQTCIQSLQHTTKTEICSPHNNNRNQFQHVDPVDHQFKYLGGEDSKEGWYQMWFRYTNFADGIFGARLLNCKTLCPRLVNKIDVYLKYVKRLFSGTVKSTKLTSLSEQMNVGPPRMRRALVNCKNDDLNSHLKLFL